MKIKDYIEHIVTYYNLYNEKLNDLLKKAGIINDSSSAYKICSFTRMASDPTRIYLHFCEKKWSKLSKNAIVDRFLPVQKSFLYNRYVFGNGEFYVQNNEVIEEANDILNELVNDFITNEIRFEAMNMHIHIEPIINLGESSISFKIQKITGFPNDDYDYEFKFLIKEGKFTIDYEIFEELFKEIEIPEYKIPKGFEKIYQNRNLDLYQLNRDENIVKKLKNKD